MADKAPDPERHEEIYPMYRDLASRPMDELGFADLMLLTGHDKCCGERLRQDGKKNMTGGTVEIWRMGSNGELIDREDFHVIEAPNFHGIVTIEGNPTEDPRDAFLLRIPFTLLAMYVHRHEQERGKAGV